MDQLLYLGRQRFTGFLRNFLQEPLENLPCLPPGVPTNINTDTKYALGAEENEEEEKDKHRNKSALEGEEDEDAPT